MKRTNTLPVSIYSCLALLCLVLVFQSCREDLEGTLPVIKEDLVGDYLESHPEYFSEFTQLLNHSGVMGLLKAYGHYTVFAPTNEAMERYYRFLSKDKGETITSTDQLSITEMREICYNHIIKDTLRTKDMHEGILGVRSMSDRFYSVRYTDSAIVINDYSPIVSRDNMLHNGIVHVLSEVILPAPGAIAEVFEKDSSRFSIYVKALKATGLYSFMNRAKQKDENYNPAMGFQPNPSDRFITDYIVESKPISRKLGFTILAVSDADLASYVDEAAGLPNGIHSLADLEKLARYHYGITFNHDADNIADRTHSKNYLNRFMSYHCFNRVMYSSRFVKDYFTPNHYPQYPMPEYIETMLENTIVEVLLDKQGTVIGPAMAAHPKSGLGVFNYDDPAQRALLTDILDLPQGGAENGYYHGINRPIMYTKTLPSALSSKRLRMDLASFLPELTTNNLRGSNTAGNRTSNRLTGWVIDDNYVGDYEGYGNTRITYEDISSVYFQEYQCDAFAITGAYNFTLKTCPIPAGTYEVRLGLIGGRAQLSQLYIDSIPCGIPINLSVNSMDELGSGFVEPGSDKQDPYGYENDKVMRYRGFMKNPSSFGTINTDGTIRNVRLKQSALRRIIGTFTFEKTTKHSLTVIMLGSSNQPFIQDAVFLDYMEFCPVSLLDKEGID